MNLPRLGGSLANAFALAALPLWWYLDPSRGLDAPLPGRDAWEARVGEIWGELAAGVEVRGPQDRSTGCDEIGILADGTTFPPLGNLCRALRSQVAALRACGLTARDGFAFALLVRSDSPENQAVARTGDSARDACIQRALSGLPLADSAPPGGALVAVGSVDLVGLQPEGPLPSREAWDALLADAWERTVADVRVRAPGATTSGCRQEGFLTDWTADLCGELRATAPALRECGFTAEDGFGFALLARSGSEENQAVVHSGDPARDACAERVLEQLPLAERLTRGGSAIASGSTDMLALERSESWKLEPLDSVPEPPMAYASHLGDRVKLDPTSRWVTDPAASIVVDDVLVARIHEWVACPSVRVGTRLRANWADGVLTVQTDPPVSCVEANVRARSEELLGALAAGIDPTEPGFADRVAEAGPPRGWPDYHLDLWVVLPEVAP